MDHPVPLRVPSFDIQDFLGGFVIADRPVSELYSL
jgi:hypothetical protein